ncbi:MAG: hypothetical protein DRZ76_00995 [Candidatus Nealsonbacteria bacterium]|mgnify:CR=1 FL=1|nr:MAG: hypothetical protein DRZ76_00995 [Candidatus Nealsonbacteria bacterium]
MEIIRERLSNGLTVILAPIEGRKTVCEMFAVRAGWKYEWPEIYGLSHFIEHMMFRGTKKRPSGEKITGEIESRGGEINAGTNDEYTVYVVKIAGRFINIAHDVISDMILNSKLESAKIKIEKGPILEERSMSLDNAVAYLQNILWPKLLYGDQPVAQMGLGTEETITKMKRKQFLDYIDGLYVAPNSAVIVTGQIENPREVIDDLESYYGKLSSREPTIHKPPVIEKQRRPRISFKHWKIEQTHVLLGVRGYSIFHPDRYALKVLEKILGGGMSSRMFIEVREKRGLAYVVSSGIDFQTDTGWFVTYAGLNSKRIAEGLEVMMEQYRRLADEKISPRELKDAQDSIIGSQEMELENADNLASFIAEQFLLKNEIETPEERTEKFKAVSADDVQRVVQDICQNKKLNLAIVGPYKHYKLKGKLYQILRF